jgi:thiol-disulfide isomerase/thioredoxin
MLKHSALLLIALLVGACSQVNSPREGHYRAVLTLPGGELPVHLEFAHEVEGPVITLINGEERVRVTDVTLKRGQLTAKFPGIENRLEAKVRRRRWQGEVIVIRKGGEEQRIPFEAHWLKDGYYSFFEGTLTDNADVAGRWEVTFTADNNDSYSALGEFAQVHDRVSGTFLTPTGDHHFLTGQVRNNEVRMGMFDGAHAFLYHAQVNEQGNLDGEYWSGLHSHERWQAKRNPEFELPHDLAAPLASAALSFTLPDINQQPVSLADERFKNKVVLVTLGGSWCGNCHDEAAFLVPFYKEYRERGFEVVGLMFERFGDFKQASDATQRFARHFGIEYPLLIAGISDTDEASKLFPNVPPIYAFPTAYLLDKQGNVRYIHAGFAGPATGQHHETYRREFTARVEQLLTEPPARE